MEMAERYLHKELFYLITSLKKKAQHFQTSVIS